MPKGKRYTKEEDAVIIANNPNMTIDKLAVILPGRTRISIESRRAKLGLIKYPTRMKKEEEFELDKKIALLKIKNKAIDLGRIPKRSDFNYSEINIIVKSFGTFTGGLVEAGFKPNHTVYNRKKFIEDIKAFYKKNKHAPRYRELSNSRHIYLYFNSFNEALKEAGLTTSYNVNVSEKELIESLKQFYKDNKRPPRMKEARRRNNLYSPRLYYKVLKCKYWKDVLYKAGIYI